MSAQTPNNSDTHWFLENPDDSKSKDDRSDLSENQKHPGNSELDRWRQEYAASRTNENQTNTKQMRPERINWDDTGSKSGNNLEEITNKIDLASSGGLVQSGTDNDPVRIVLKSDALDNPTKDHEIPKITEKQNNPEIRITLSDEIEQSLNKENEININKEKSVDNAKQPTTIYVLLKDKKGSIEKIGNTDSNTETCTEVGSTVINVNDFLSPDHQLSGNESISTAVNYSPSGQAASGSPQQMELVITIKDERDKTKESTFKLPSEKREIPIKLEKSSDSNVANITRSSSNYMTSSETSWDSISDSRRRGRGDEGEGEYSEERDSWVRESDGAHCQRTVVTTPRGKKVHTHCYKDAGPRRTRAQRRVQDWSSSVNSFFDDLDNELSGFFNQVNRLLFY